MPARAHFFLAVICFIWPLASPAKAAPDDLQAQCLAAYTEGQRARHRGAFIQAKEAWAFCSSAACPAALHHDCDQWLGEVEEGIPTSIFRVVDPDGTELQKAALKIDNAPAVTLLGRALELDPGEHRLEFSVEGYQTKVIHLVFTEGEQRKEHEVQLTPKPTASQRAPTLVGRSHSRIEPTEEVAARSSVPVWIGSGIGVLGAAGFAYFGLKAREQERALDDCTPNCTLAQVDEVKQNYLVANISIGAGALGVLGAVGWLLFRSDETRDSAAGSPDLEVQLGLTTRLRGRF